MGKRLATCRYRSQSAAASTDPSKPTALRHGSLLLRGSHLADVAELRFARREQLAETTRGFPGDLEQALRGRGLAQGNPAPEPQPFGLLGAKGPGVMGEEQEVPKTERQVGHDAGGTLVLDAKGRPF